jgi:hypothetical protein
MVDRIDYRGYCDDHTGNPMKHGTIVYDHGPLMLGSDIRGTCGKRIFEGDIVVSPIYEYSIGQVFYLSAQFLVQWDDDVVTPLLSEQPLAVIGNIHEGEVD